MSAPISNGKTILILGNSLVEPINTKQFSQEYDVDKYVVFTIDQAQKKLANLKKRYDKILLQLITNDIKEDSVENVISNMTTLVDEATKVSNEIVVSLGPPRSDKQEWKSKTEEVNIQLTSIYQNSSKVKVSNNSNLGNRGTPISRLYRDEVHLTYQGTYSIKYEGGSKPETTQQ